MRATIQLDDELLIEAKRAAAANGQSLSDLVAEMLREYFRGRPPASRQKVILPTFKGDGTLLGVDPDNSRSLLDLMDGTGEF
jgi:hypothetical protein